MDTFAEVYKGLNQAQKQAVDAVDGPVLVVAGPGTGKTQLLSARVAQILRKTDALAQNILCLTFTESGAANMRDRLSRFIGKDAYDVQIGTYHSFGSDLIRRFPEYFTETRLERPVDELGKREILTAIVDGMAYRNPLKQTRHHLGDLVSTISEVKRGLLSAEQLRTIAADNLRQIEQSQPDVAAALAPFIKRMPGKLAAAEPVFREVLDILENLPETELPGDIRPLAGLASTELSSALVAAREDNSSKPLTAWKNTWLIKNNENEFVLNGALASARVGALADVLEAYQAALSARGLYDFDDMILRAIAALETHDELKYSLQEQYQYILLDEFQDTNAAQLRLVELLSENPANEGRPNVLAVGDDDQAIYAFQGAQYSNMLDFFKLYRDVLVINLTENYRSTEPILETARAVATQVTDSLSGQLPDLDKTLTAAGKPTETTLSYTEYTSDVAERAAVAQEIASLIQDGAAPHDIAVLAPKHRYLEPLVPYLHDHQVPVSYERRENILEAPAIRQLLIMSRLVLALANRDFRTADSLWPEVLSYDFWHHPTADIWRLSWQAGEDREPWTKLLLDSPQFQPCAVLFLTLAAQAAAEPLEIMLDRLIGTEEVITNDPLTPSVRSPFRVYYAGGNTSDDRLYRAVTELSVLRARLREHEQGRGDQLVLADLIAFTDAYISAEQQLLNTSPYNQSADAVQLMTVFKAKGLEFKHVFILHAQDDVWGNSSSGIGNKLTLPANLSPIRHAGATEDERLRIFFVALTRAKAGLHLSSYRMTYAGKQVARLKYLGLIEADGVVTSSTLPENYRTAISDDRQPPALTALEHDWRGRNLDLSSDLYSLLQERLSAYQLSPTHLVQYVDLEHAGPQAFLLQTLLRFPSAPSVDIAYGNAMHHTFEWIQAETNLHGNRPAVPQIRKMFTDFLTREHVYGEAFAVQEARGHDAVAGFLASPEGTFTPGNIPEYSFRNEGVFIDNAVHLAGKIDLLEIDETAKTIAIVDYKTGRLGSDPAKLHRYTLQLYCYKLLVEGSHRFKDYSVIDGRLVFVEPDDSGAVVTKKISYTAAETERVRQLLTAVWDQIKALALPDTSEYAGTFAGINQFESDLINGQS